MKKRLALVALAVLVAGGAFVYWNMANRVVSSDFARLEGGTLGVSVSVTGNVAEAYVKAGDFVAQGQPLFVLDKSGYEMHLARERTKLAEIAATIPGNVLLPSPTAAQNPVPGKPLAALKTDEDEARKAVEVASHVFAAANIALSRYDAAGKRDLAERQKLLIQRDEAAISLKNAKEAYEKVSYARAQREALDKTLLSSKPVSAALATRIAEYQAQVSRVRLAEQSLAATVVVSPEAGKVAFMAATPGVALSAGDVPVTIVPENTKDLWVTAFFAPEDASLLTVNKECFVIFPDEKEPVKGFIGAVQEPAGAEKRFAVHVVLNENAAFSSAMIGRDVSVYVPAGKIFSIPGLH